MDEIPEPIMNELTFIHESQNVPLERLKRAFITHNQQMMQIDPTMDEKARAGYIVGKLKGMYLTGPPLQEYTVMPIGYEGQRKEKSGTLRSTIFAMTKLRAKPSICSITCRGPASEIYKSINLGYQYSNVLLSRYENSDDLQATERTQFLEPKQTSFFKNYETILTSLGVPRIEVEDAEQNLAKTTSTGYSINTDWRLIRGQVRKCSAFTKKNGTTGGVLEIFNPKSRELDEHGRLNTLTCWIPAEQAIYSLDDIVDVAGALSVWIDKDKVQHPATMAGFLVVPILTFAEEE